MKEVISYLKVEDTTLSYVERNPEKEFTIFFLHGNSGSWRAWIPQLKSPLLSLFRMVAFDLPGHGNSEVPEPAETYYSVTGLAKILATAINELSGNKPYILAGLSLGNNIACESLSSTSPKGLVMISPCIIGSDYPLSVLFKPEADLSAVFTDEPDKNLVCQTLKNCLYTSSPEQMDGLVADYHNVKGNFRSHFYQSVQDQRYNDEVKLLEESRICPLILFGESDPISNIHYLDPLAESSWSGKIFKINEASHFLQMDQPLLINEQLYAYLKDVFHIG